MYKDKRVEKKKTVVMKRCLNPVFNESFAFDIPTERLRETTIVITVMDKDRLSRNDVIGKVGPTALVGGGGIPVMCPAGGQPRLWLMATGATSSWRGRWSVVGVPRSGRHQSRRVVARTCPARAGRRCGGPHPAWQSPAPPCCGTACAGLSVDLPKKSIHSEVKIEVPHGSCVPWCRLEPEPPPPWWHRPLLRGQRGQGTTGGPWGPRPPPDRPQPPSPAPG